MDIEGRKKNARWALTASDAEVGPACCHVSVPPTIVTDEEFREAYTQGYRHALSDVRKFYVASDPRCDTCAHWDRDQKNTHRGQCCVLDHVHFEDVKIWASYMDAIITTPDFGCTMWQKSGG